MNDFKFITGTFLDGLASDIPSNNWTKKQWAEQFDIMKEMEIDTALIIRVGFRDSAMYYSPVMNTTLYEKNDLIELIFSEADRTEIKMFIGMFDTDFYWLKNDWEKEVEANSKLIEELWQRYKHHKSFYGWYMSHEGDMKFHQEKIWKPLIKKAKSYDSTKKILVSPRYAGIKYEPRFAINPEQHYKHFDYIFTEMEGLIDIAAFMDGHVQFSELENFVKITKKVCDKHSVSFWSNLETFDRDMPWRFPPIEWMKMRHKMEVVQPYVEKIITFEAPHFLSPLSMFPSAANLYKRYMEYKASFNS